MNSRTSSRQMWPLALAAFFALASAHALAQSPPPTAVETDQYDEDTAAAPEVKKDEDILKDVDIDKLDWSQLNIDASMLDLSSVKARAAAAKNADGNNAAWSSNAKGNGASAVSV